MVEDVVTPTGPYRLRLMCRTGRWRASLPAGGVAEGWQRADGRVVVRAPDAESLSLARFMLALDDDTRPFHARFATDPLLGPSARALVGYRPLRLPTVAHALLRACCGQLIEARRARALERIIIRACGAGEVVTQDALRRVAPVELRRLGLGQHRATALSRIVRTLELERLRDHPTSVVRARLEREPGIGPWSVGVVALEGLGRYDHGLVGDLGLVKLCAALWGRWPEAGETEALLTPYGEWAGLAGEILMLGWSRGLVPGADRDAPRRIRQRRAA